MEKQLNQLTKIKNLRLFLLQQVAGLTTAQLNQVPAGYSNNVIWHLAHLTSAAQAICYLRAGLPSTIEEKYLTPFLPGTRPERVIDDAEVEVIKTLFIHSIDTLRVDFERGLFTTYAPSERIAAIYGVEVATIADALDFVLYHEGFHSGYIVALKHLV
ncbi:MAG: DinB family protein [Janthinobacterium lividum]